MDNRDNELFNGIIDVPNANTNNIEPNLGLSQSNLQMTSNNNTQPQANADIEIIDIPVDNRDVMAGPAETQVTSPEIIDFDFESKPEEVNAQGKVVNRELLQNLNKDTNNLVNPDMIINPLGKSETPSVSINMEEPKVDYDRIKTKKGYAFMAIIFLIIIVFIIFLPQIMSFIGI